MQDYWLRQKSDKPLFEDILWSRPENRATAGKLLIVGGNAHGFLAVGEAFTSADRAGAGKIHILLPDALRKTVGAVLDNTEYVPSTPSGSFATKSLGDVLQHSQWADMVLLAGDLGRNSETSVLLESFVQKYTGLLTVTKDAVDYFYHTPELLLQRENTCLVLSLGQLQKLGTACKFQTPFLLSMGMMLLVQALRDFSLLYPVVIVTRELNQLVVAYQGRVSSTPVDGHTSSATPLSTQDDSSLVWRVETSAKSSVFWMQNPSTPFEAITTALL
jgi:hypothetical protein